MNGRAADDTDRRSGTGTLVTGADERSDTTQPQKHVLSYVATFLRPEMLHVYRQVTNLRRFDCDVATRRRENAGRFPFSRVHCLRKSPLRLIQRQWQRLRGLGNRLSKTEVTQLRRLGQLTKADIVHVYLGTEAARALPWLQTEPLPKLVSFHGADVSDSLRQADLEALCSCVDLFTARSESLRKALIERGCPADRIVLNLTGIPMPEAALPAGPDLSVAPLRLIQAGRLIPKKAFDITLRALARLRDEGIAAHLTIAGEGQQAQELRELSHTLQLDGQVDFLGFVDNAQLMAAFRDHHIFLHPSRETRSGDREGIPNAMLEAMAAGLPVIATAHSGIPEVIADGENGLLVPSDDAESLAAAIRRLSADRQLWHRLQANGREEVVGNFSIDAAIAGLEDAYLHCIDLAASPNRYIA